MMRRTMVLVLGMMLLAACGSLSLDDGGLGSGLDGGTVKVVDAESESGPGGSTDAYSTDVVASPGQDASPEAGAVARESGCPVPFFTYSYSCASLPRCVDVYGGSRESDFLAIVCPQGGLVREMPCPAPSTCFKNRSGYCTEFLAPSSAECVDAGGEPF